MNIKIEQMPLFIEYKGSYENEGETGFFTIKISNGGERAAIAFVGDRPQNYLEICSTIIKQLGVKEGNYELWE